jgi:hypothetical protein
MGDRVLASLRSYRSNGSCDGVALLPALPGTCCAPGTRCIRVSANGRPQASSTSIAQCRGEFADFIVPRTSVAYAVPGLPTVPGV